MYTGQKTCLRDPYLMIACDIYVLVMLYILYALFHRNISTELNYKCMRMVHVWVAITFYLGLRAKITPDPLRNTTYLKFKFCKFSPKYKKRNKKKKNHHVFCVC